MSTLSYDFDSYLSYGSKERTLADSDISFIEIRDIVISVNFINFIKASFLDHWQSTTRSFLRWLKQKPNEFIRWNFVLIIFQNLSGTQYGNHMTIMAAHMSVVSCRLIFQIMVELRHWEAIHISSDSN